MLHKVQFKNRKIKFLTQVIYGRTIFYNYFFSIILTWQMNALIISHYFSWLFISAKSIF